MIISGYRCFGYIPASFSYMFNNAKTQWSDFATEFRMSVMFVLGVALLVWATVIGAAQVRYWMIADQWVPINVFHTAFVHMYLGGDGYLVSLVMTDNRLANLMAWLPSSGFRSALRMTLDMLPFSGCIGVIGAAIIGAAL